MLLVSGLVDFGEVIEDLAVPVSKLLPQCRLDFSFSTRPLGERCIADIELFPSFRLGEVTCKVRMMIFKVV